MHIEVASVDSVILYFGNKVDKNIAKKVKNAYLCIKDLNDDGIIEIIPSYSSILVTYNILKYDFYAIKKLLNEKIDLNTSIKYEDNIITVDVYYGEDVGFDLLDISKKTNLSVDAIIKLHTSKLYDVYAIGFAPGFAYLASVDEKIAIPRLDTPRKNIPKGSVAIANTQTAVYPQSSPGGWNIIGRTTFEFFDKTIDELTPVKVGDKIKFNPISKDEFIKQGGKI